MPNRDATNRIFIIVSVTAITKRYLLPSGYFSMVRNTIIIHTGIYLLQQPLSTSRQSVSYLFITSCRSKCFSCFFIQTLLWIEGNFNITDTLKSQSPGISTSQYPQKRNLIMSLPPLTLKVKAKSKSTPTDPGNLLL